MTYCGERTIVKAQPGEYTASSLRCRAWTCAECQPQRSRQLVAQAHGGAPTTFLTLTSRRKPELTPYDAAMNLSRAWRLLRLRIMRHRKLKNLPFLAVFEATQNGWPHLHILLRSIWIDQRWISAQMAELADAPVVDIQRIRNRAQVNAYVAKYVGKAPHKFGSAKRYWQSRDYDLRPAQPEKLPWREGVDWWQTSRNLGAWCRSMEALAWSVERLGLHKARARPPPGAALRPLL